MNVLDAYRIDVMLQGILAITFERVVRLLPSLIEDAVAVSLLRLLSRGRPPSSNCIHCMLQPLVRRQRSFPLITRIVALKRRHNKLPSNR
ncbi:hypothetical protein PLICRDRAFT_541939 [Plicaturopsis crispa FD-325 SS-3]|nr:hypothetical protein PLICRDRAFT_541939 [Plicaturopsis crispa FD-325 SS-3]